MSKMITLNITEVLLSLISVLFLFLAYKYYNLLNENKQLYTKFENEKTKAIEELKKEHDLDMKSFEDELLQLEELAKKKIEETEKTYQNVIDDINKDVTLYEKYIINISTAIRLSDEKLKEIDSSGSFKTDDEIGWFFDSVKNIQKILNEFKVEAVEKNK